KENVIEFLEEIKEKNKGKKIVVVLDNFSSHTSVKVKEIARKLVIVLVFLPPYSPELKSHRVYPEKHQAGDLVNVFDP
ncbi:MAG: transposase, partial [Halobacteriota archaeon]|nr:transposase [Halobacteriota archaeon]